MATSADTTQNPVGLLVRAAIPALILLGGWLGFQQLAEEVVKPPPQAEDKLQLRTRVQELEVIDYRVVISTHAVVQPHNMATLTSEVAGVVTRISESFEVGSYFTEGEVLVEIDSRDYKTALSIAESELSSSRSALKLARLNEERKLRLIESSAVSQAEVDVASATREQAEADVELATTRVEQARLNLERTKVVAPFDGRVQTKLIGVGQMATNNSPLGEVFAIDFAEVRLPISGQQRQYLDLPEFQDDDPIKVTLRDALGASDDNCWRAKIVRTEGVLDENSRDLFAIARIDDPFGRASGEPPLRIGQPVEAFIKGQVLRDVIALPRGAVRELDRIVLVNQPDRTLLPMDIEALWSDANHVVVRADSIPKGTWLATTPMSFTPRGSVVDIIPDTDEAETSIADSTPGDAESVAN